ncbi:MAG: D-alanine--D-alanine ligase [Holophagales bacterium]|nr:MAG: D-alanine--D-alanine ligase [Holophagales bacterium]
MSRVIVLTGGSTPERDVALAGAAQVVGALRDRGHEVAVADTVEGVLDEGGENRLLATAVRSEPPTPAELERLAERENLPSLLKTSAFGRADLVFLVLHGRQGEGGEVQTLLEMAGLRYTGSGPVGSALAMDKEVAKRLFRDGGIPTPDWAMLPATDADLAALGLPLIVKPLAAGSTVGLSVVRALADLPAAIATAAEVDPEVMAERFLPGREFSVGVLGDRALGVGEIVPQHEIFDYECKYTPGMSQEIFPAAIPDGLTERMRALALAAHRCLKLRDFSRVDFRLDEAGAPHVLEANTLPGMTRTSLMPQSARVLGLDFADLCEAIVRQAMSRPVH